MRRLLTILLVLVSVALAPAAQASPPREVPPSIQVGTQLTALRDVTVRQATIAKGSRVKVTHVAKQGSRAVAVSLELKDGHVLQNVAIGIVQNNFRIAR